jgi:lysozyme family protein
MAASTYDDALRRLLVHEGGYSNHPSDPGGSTNFGITIADYRACVKPDATADDARNMTVDVADAQLSPSLIQHGERGRFVMSAPIPS